MPRETAAHLPGLNTVRFLLALNVLLVHATSGASPLPFLWGPNAVTFFFVLSGYVVTYRLLLERQTRGTIDMRAFYSRRAWRILPLYYCVALVGGVILPLFGAPAPSPAALLSVLLMIPQLMYAFTMPYGVIIPLWSVGVEVVFYLGIPLLLRRGSVPRISLVVIAGSLGVSALAAALHSPLLPLVRLMRLECMMVGALAAWLVVSGSPWLRVVHHRAVERGAIGGLILLSLIPLALPAYDLIFSALAAVFLLNISTNPRPLLRLEWRWSKAAANLSYGLYLWHYPILWALWHTMEGISLLLVSLVISLLVAGVSYQVIERPLMTGSPQEGSMENA